MITKEWQLISESDDEPIRPSATSKPRAIIDSESDDEII
jgi:hypothetical protein